MSKKSERARDLLLCSSMITYILTALSGCPVGWTLMRLIFKHDFSQDVPATNLGALWYHSSCYWGVLLPTILFVRLCVWDPRWRTVLCSQLLHMLHDMSVLQCLALYPVDKQHLNQIPLLWMKISCTFRGFSQKARHSNREWSFQCKRQ